jgi:hypothetical protein
VIWHKGTTIPPDLQLAPIGSEQKPSARLRCCHAGNKLQRFGVVLKKKVDSDLQMTQVVPANYLDECLRVSRVSKFWNRSIDSEI